MEEKILRMKSGKVYRLEGKAQTPMGMSIDYLIDEWINHPDKIMIFEDSEYRNVWTRLGNIEDIEDIKNSDD